MNREAPSYKEGDKDTSFICDRNLDRKKIIEDIIHKNELSNFKQYLTKGVNEKCISDEYYYNATMYI